MPINDATRHKVRLASIRRLLSPSRPPTALLCCIRVLNRFSNCETRSCYDCAMAEPVTRAFQQSGKASVALKQRPVPIVLAVPLKEIEGNQASLVVTSVVPSARRNHSLSLWQPLAAAVRAIQHCAVETDERGGCNGLLYLSIGRLRCPALCHFETRTAAAKCPLFNHLAPQKLASFDLHAGL